MPHFHFVLKRGWQNYRDVDGGEFPNEAAALEHGRMVAHELMRNREAASRHWRLEIRNDSDGVAGEIFFALLDDVLAEQRPELRARVEHFYRTSGSLNDAIAAVRMSVLQVRATLARADKAPYLAAINGERL